MQYGTTGKTTADSFAPYTILMLMANALPFLFGVNATALDSTG
jgi:hypothetical protein